MKTLLLGILICLFTSPLAAQNPSYNMDSVSYALGVVISENLKSQGFQDLNTEEFAQAIHDGLAGSTSIDPNQANQILQNFMRAKQEEEAKVKAKEGEDFLAQNAKRPEVKVTESGLQYEVLTPGTGASPSATETVEVHYHGTLIDGTIFDSSVDRGQTIEFPLNRVIPGWTEGVQLMKEGAKYRFFIPYDLAYGPQGSAPKIPPYSALVFDVELFKVK